MRQYSEFHGEMPANLIGKRLREIAATERAFKIITGYGSRTGVQRSKQAALKALSNMTKEGIIAAYLPGEKVFELSGNVNDVFYKARTAYESILRTDCDKGNEGIIYVFVR